jgi:glycerophosphoryl diester phosphodiesterase
MLSGPFGTPADALAYLLLLVVALSVWRLMWRGRPLPAVRRGATLLVGHRGTRGARPENTLAAFRYALEAGLDGIEFDVRRTLDGVLVIRHDRLVDGFPVSAQTRHELRERLPSLATLDELFALAGSYPGRLLNLEIKTEGVRTGGLERDVVRAVVASGLAGQVLISSFNSLSLARVRLRSPRLRVALLYEASSTRRAGGHRLAGWLHVDAVHPAAALVAQQLVRAAHARGVAVNVWTVNDEADIRRLRALGVDAIMGDDPETLLSSARGGQE